MLVSTLSLTQAQDDISLNELELDKGLEELALDSEGLDKFHRNDVQRRGKDFKYIPPKMRAYWSKSTRLSDLVDYGVTKVFIPRGTILIDIEQNKKIKITRDIFSNAINGFDDYGICYILDKKLIPKYKVHNKKIEFLKETANLEITPNSYKEYNLRPPKTESKLQSFHEVSTFYFYGSSNYIENVASNEVSRLEGAGVEYQGFLDLEFPIIFGAELSFVNGYAQSVDFNYELTELVFGPIINFHAWNLFERKVFVQAKAGFSLFSKLVSRDFEEDLKFQSQSLGTGLRGYFPTIIGDLLWSMDANHLWYYPKSGSLPNQAVDRTTKENRFRFALGYSW